MAKQSKYQEFCKTEYPFYMEDGNRFILCENSESGGKYWKGRHCDNYVKVEPNVKAVLCSRCTQSAVGAPKISRMSTATTKPKGWALMPEFVDSDLNVYYRGIIQEELKGTLPQTVIQPKAPKILSEEDATRKLKLETDIKALKRKLIAERDKTVIKKIGASINKLEVELKTIK